MTTDIATAPKTLHDIVHAAVSAHSFLFTTQRDDIVFSVVAALNVRSTGWAQASEYAQEVGRLHAEMSELRAAPAPAAPRQDEAAEAKIKRLRGTLEYIAAQAKAGYPTVLSCIRANAEAALDDAWQATYRTAVASLAHPPAASAAADWQPIETAPKTTKSRLVWCPERKNIYAVTWCDDGYWMHWGGSTRELTEEPTHWMPLPEPPALAAPEVQS